MVSGSLYSTGDGKYIDNKLTTITTKSVLGGGK
jgi:hypothetical protein